MVASDIFSFSPIDNFSLPLAFFVFVIYKVASVVITKKA